jgi:hypothetical protein
MNKKVNKIYFESIHKTSITKETMNLGVLKDIKIIDSIEKTIECLDELSNLILIYKIHLHHIKNDSKLKDFKL